MKLTNNKIYNYAINLSKVFNTGDQYLPAKVNFFIQKNKKMLIALGADIEEARIAILSNYGELAKDGVTYNFTVENANHANQELNDLLEIEQEVAISKIKLSDLNGLDFTVEQMQAIMFMIEED